MHRFRRICRLVLLTVFLCATHGLSWAESGYLVVHVKDVQDHPISGLQIGVTGDGGVDFTKDDGKARIPLAKDTKQNTWVTLQIVKSPRGTDFVMVSPWDHTTLVPSFENESGNVVEVVVVQRNDQDALKSGRFIASLLAQVNKANASKAAGKQATEEDPKANLAKVAQQYGLAPEGLDKAIRAWKTADPYEAGLKALYERNYDKASADLASSLKQREEKLAADQKSVADAACFLGQSLYDEGEYNDSATAYQRCLQLRANDGAVLNNLASSLYAVGDYAGAEPLYRHALAINEKAWGPDHPYVARNLTNLALLLKVKGNLAAAEPLFRRALAIDEEAFGPDYPRVATNLANLAALLEEKGDYEAAEPLYRRALAIDEKALGPDHPDSQKIRRNLESLKNAAQKSEK